MSRVNGMSPANGLTSLATSIRKGYVYLGEERIGFLLSGSRGEWTWGTMGLEVNLDGFTYEKRKSAEACVKAWKEATKK